MVTSRLGRRSLLAGSVALAACSRREPPAEATPKPPPTPASPPVALPDVQNPDASRAPRGRVAMETWTFDGDGRAAVIVPAWTEPSAKLPVLVALHGRGEANKGPELGVMGWPRDYALLRAIERVCAPPLTSADLEGFVDPTRLASLNEGLAARPFGGLVVVCPYLPDLDLRKAAPMRAYGRYLFESVLPRVRKELPVLDAPRATGIDGVSLGGAVALRVGLENPEAFGAVGTLQAAIGQDQVPELTELARAARARNPSLYLRLLTSKEDYFRGAIRLTSQALRAAKIEHELVDIPGPHDYPFNRGPGAIEMLLWHDQVLARG